MRLHIVDADETVAVALSGLSPLYRHVQLRRGLRAPPRRKWTGGPPSHQVGSRRQDRGRSYFVGPDIIGGSLADGSYTLTVRADQIHDRFGQELDGDGNGSAGGDRVDNSSRLFGDADGQVDHSDRNVVRSTFKTNAGEVGYLWYFDFDGDNRQFNRRFGQS